jgi:hypothetical protein
MLRRSAIPEATVIRSLSVLFAAAFALTACGSSPTTTPGPDPALVTWMGQVCTAARAFDPMPPFLGLRAPTTETDRQPLLDWLQTVTTTMLTAQDAFAKVDTPPTPAARTMFDTLRTDLTDAVSQLSHEAGNAVLFPADKLTAVYTLSIVAVSPWEEGGPKLGYYLKDRPDLTAAHDHAPPCTATTASPSPTS